MSTFHTLLKDSLCGLPSGIGCGTGLVPSLPRCVFSISHSIPPKIATLGKPVQPLGRSETSASTWQYRTHSGVKCFLGKAIALGKKNPKCLWFMFSPIRKTVF